MKKILSRLTDSQAAWIILTAAGDIFFSVLLWTAGSGQIIKYITVIALFSIITIFAGCYYQNRKKDIIKKALENFISHPDQESENALISAADSCWRSDIENAATANNQLIQQLRCAQNELNEYREFIEAWAHEIKTPLSLAVLVLDNHKDEMSPYVFSRMEHVRHSVSSDVDRILYYARLSAVHADYKFEKTDLKEVVSDVIMNFSGECEERGIKPYLSLNECTVKTDKRVISFIISQLISNAYKYSDKSAPEVQISITSGADCPACLKICNNTKNCHEEDMPFIFDKGFTGDSPNRRTASGMGLYFVKKFCEMLCARVDAELIKEDDGALFMVSLWFEDAVEG
ncbi:MAG: HAMP domain-containing sensor histidine kinase [Oscillospiraceae bacterium]|nr:HAMP domain-containing sensor histidine kinase [Oscillospiraceae bacterium]